MRELKQSEVSEVSGGIFPVVMAIIGVDLALNGLLIGYAAYAAANFHAEK